MIETGRVLSVEEELPGSVLAASAIVGAEEIEVESTEEFNENGGHLQIRSGATVQARDYGPPDDEDNLLTLLSPLTTAVEDGDEVTIPGAIERYAAVALEDAPDEAIYARIPHSLIQRLPAGVRDLDDLDAVTIREEKPGFWVVQDVLARELARPGYSETNWTNEHGIKLITSDLENGVSEMLFGSWEFVAENAGPVATTFTQGTADPRRIGTVGPSSGAIRITLDFPAKLTMSAEASVLNDSPEDWNVRFYIVVMDPDDPDYISWGRQGTQWTNSGDADANRHRQVSRSRSYVMLEGTPEAPAQRTLWWGFKQDTTINRQAEVRNMSMTIRVAYAPDMPTATDPDRSPAWTDHADTIESYLRTETEDDT